MKEINHKDDRKLLLELCDHLFISKNNLRRDELNYWNLVGRKGWIDSDSEYWYVRMECKSSLLWKRIKSSLKFMDLWQDGDDEGALRLHRYPSEEEAQKIRKLAGFTVSRKLDEKEKEELKWRLKLIS